MKISKILTLAGTHVIVGSQGPAGPPGVGTPGPPGADGPPGPPGASTWGVITGLLSDQTDLQTVLDTIPTLVSELTNDSGYITSASIPTLTSQLTNDSGYITSASIPTLTSQLTNDSGYITSSSSNALTNKTGNISQWTNDSGYITSASIPTLTSQLTNDSGFITSSSSNALTNKTGNISQWTNDSGYLTGNLVTSVFSRTGAVTAQSGDYNSSQVTENTNLYFTQARAIASPLTGYSASVGTIFATDTILQAIQKITGNITAAATQAAGGDLNGFYPNPTLNNASVISRVLTGYTSGAGTISATDTILTAIQKLNGNNAAQAAITISTTSPLTGGGSLAANRTFSWDFTVANTWNALQTFASNLTSPTVQGSIASGGNLTLSSTSHATKGKILLGTLSAYDQVNDRLGLGITTPLYPLHISGNQTSIPNILAGAFATQSFSNTNGFLTLNSYFNNANMVALNTGETALFQFGAPAAGGIGFRHGASVSAGAAYSLVYSFSAALDGRCVIHGASAAGLAAASAWLTIAIGTTSRAQINFGSTGVAPSSPVNGDFWFDGTNIKYRAGGATKTVTAT